MANRKSRTRHRVAAFTLIEVLLVLVILVVLASFGVGMFTRTQERANLNSAKAQIGLFETPIATYQLDTGQYPASLDALLAAPSDLADPSRWNGPYMKKVPPDPWGNEYQYSAPGAKNPDSYDVWSFGPDRADGTADDLGNW